MYTLNYQNISTFSKGVEQYAILNIHLRAITQYSFMTKLTHLQSKTSIPNNKSHAKFKKIIGPKGSKKEAETKF